MKKTLLSLLLFIPFIGFGQLVTFSFTGSVGSETSFPPDAQPSNTVVSNITRGSVPTASNNSNTFSSTNWPTGGLDANAYYEITLTPNVNSTLSLSSLVLTERRSGTGIRDWQVRSSVDNFASSLGTFAVPDDTNDRNGQTTTFPANSNFTARTTAITFRIYGYTSEASGGSWRLDNVVFNGTSTLPISLTSFTGKAIDQSVLLNWETASESNNNYFEVLKSSNGKTFSAIGTVKGSGTTTDAKIYSLVDNNPAAGTNYYQLVQYDFDGKSSKSDVIPVNSTIANSSLTVYAAASSVNVSINSANATNGTLKIFDITGKKLNETKLSLTKGFNTLSLPLSLNSGIHVINFITSAEIINSKFIKD
jgi:hypothetical protein